MSQDPKTLYLVDGFALVFRAYYALFNRPLVNSKGENTGAVYGFLRMVLRLLRDKRPENLVVVFDSPGKNFRHDLYPDYKATRDKAPEDLVYQIPWLIELVELLGIPSVAREGFEADDLLASFAEHCRAKGYACRILSGDKDIMQLISPGIEVLAPTKGISEIEVFGPAEVTAKFGVPPERIADYLSLLGDTSDNVPGVPGIGEKTAVKLIQEYGGLADIYARLPEVKPDGVRKKLEAGKASADLSYELVRLTDKTGLPLPEEAWRCDALTPEKARARLVELELKTLLDDPVFKGTAAGATAEEQAVRPVDEDRSQLDYRLVSTMEELAALLADLRQAGFFAIDTETTSLDPAAARLLGVSFAHTTKQGFYVPVGHTDNPLDGPAALALIKPLLEDPALGKTGQNLKFEYSMFAVNGIALAGVAFDTMLGAYLIEPGMARYNLEELARRYLGREMIPYDDLVTKKEMTLDDVPLARVAEYAAEDAEIAFTLTTALRERLAAEKLDDVLARIDLPLVPALSEMERAGILVDVGHLAKLSASLEKTLAAREADIYAAAGGEFNINSPKQLGEILFGKMGIPSVKKTATGGQSTDEEVLQELAITYPVAKHLLEYRKLSKLKGTYVDALPAAVNPRTGRVHTSFNQAVAATGRLSSSDPNLQNIPVRDELGREVRRCFVAAPGHVFLSADYSQIELRVLAALSGDPTLSAAYAYGDDIHRRTAAVVFGVREDDVTREQRSAAKAVNFGVIYGQSAFGLAKEIGVSRGDAQRFIDAYFALYGKVRDFVAATVADAERDGFVRTWFGRLRRVPELASRNKQTRNFGERLAVNTRIQGTAADLIKLAMTGVRSRLAATGSRARLLLQVHDELLLEVPPGEVETLRVLVEEEMKRPWPFEVPVEVGVGVGANWEEAH